MILFDDMSKKTIPFVAQVVSNVPVCVMHANFNLTDGALYIFYPKYLYNSMQNFISKTISKTDINADVYDILEAKHAETSSILSLLKSDV
jgi:hypothetical protein